MKTKDCLITVSALLLVVGLLTLTPPPILLRMSVLLLFGHDQVSFGFLGPHCSLFPKPMRL